MPKQYTNTLFSDETAKLEQRPKLHLISVDIEHWGAVRTVATNPVLYDVVSPEKFQVGEFIRLTKQPGVYKVLAVVGNTVTLDREPTVSSSSTTAEHILNLVDCNYDVEYTGVTYYKFPIEYHPAAVGIDGTTETASISVASADGLVMYYIEQDPKGFAGKRVEIKTVFDTVLDNIYTPFPDGSVTSVPNPDADAFAYLREVYLIDSYAANRQVVNLALKPAIRVDVNLPRRRFMKGSCYFRFKDPDSCQYAGTATSCKKTWDACVALGNQEHFGGFPGVNSSRRIWI